jgi:hypothetical protein
LTAPHLAFLSLLTTQTSMPPAGFELAIPVTDRPQALALDSSATGIGRIRTSDHPSSRQSLYWLRHPGCMDSHCPQDSSAFHCAHLRKTLLYRNPRKSIKQFGSQTDLWIPLSSPLCISPPQMEYAFAGGLV